VCVLFDIGRAIDYSLRIRALGEPENVARVDTSFPASPLSPDC
jgi:hypothetical protein